MRIIENRSLAKARGEVKAPSNLSLLLQLAVLRQVSVLKASIVQIGKASRYFVELGSSKYVVLAKTPIPVTCCHHLPAAIPCYKKLSHYKETMLVVEACKTHSTLLNT